MVPPTSKFWKLPGKLRLRMAQQVRQLVERAADERLGSSFPLPAARLDRADSGVAQLDTAVQRLTLQLQSIAADLDSANGPFHVDLTMAGVLRRHPGARDLLAAEGLPGCGGCAVRHDERLGEAIEAYGFDGPALLAKLNALLDTSSEAGLAGSPDSSPQGGRRR